MKEITQKALNALSKGLGHEKVKATEGSMTDWGQEIVLWAGYGKYGHAGVQRGFFTGGDLTEEESEASAKKVVNYLVDAVRRHNNIPETPNGDWWGD